MSKESIARDALERAAQYIVDVYGHVGLANEIRSFAAAEVESATPAKAVELPPLPEARRPDPNGLGWFTAGQMQVYARQALADRESRLQGTSEWISVEDRLPDEGTECLVRIKGKYAHTAIDTWCMQTETPILALGGSIDTGVMWDDHDFEDITHWMPLPVAPKPGEPS